VIIDFSFDNRRTPYWRSKPASRRTKMHNIHVSRSEAKARGFWARWGERASDLIRIPRSATVPLGAWFLSCRSGHPVAVLGSGEPSQMIEFAFSASPEQFVVSLRNFDPSSSRLVGGTCAVSPPGTLDRTSTEPHDTTGDSFSSGSFSRRHHSHHRCCYAQHAGCSCKLLCR
jgi:hypothetical protein